MSPYGEGRVLNQRSGQKIYMHIDMWATWHISYKN